MILGITGTNGAGKGTVVDYLLRKGFKHYSMSGFIREEIQRRGLSVDRNTMNAVGNDLRKTRHPAYVMESLFKRAKEEGGDGIIDALRALAEANYLKEHGGILLAVDADRRVRYDRAVQRGSEKDRVSFEEFSLQEDRELAQTEAHDMNILGVMAMADYRLQNNGTPGELEAQVEQVLAKISV